MTAIGSLEIPEGFSVLQWENLVGSNEHLKPISKAKMTNPFTGDLVEIEGPPNHVAQVLGPDGEELGILRITEYDLSGIGFEGKGSTFLSLVEGICKDLGGEIEFIRDPS